jgi:hypothetical protein
MVAVVVGLVPDLIVERINSFATKRVRESIRDADVDKAANQLAIRAVLVCLEVHYAIIFGTALHFTRVFFGETGN